MESMFCKCRLNRYIGDHDSSLLLFNKGLRFFMCAVCVSWDRGREGVWWFGGIIDFIVYNAFIANAL